MHDNRPSARQSHGPHDEEDDGQYVRVCLRLYGLNQSLVRVFGWLVSCKSFDAHWGDRGTRIKHIANSTQK